MKKLVTILLLLISTITYSQTGVGYLNYTVYNMSTYKYGAGSYANSGTDFDNMFNTANGATIYGSGVTTAQNALYYANGFAPGSPGSYNGIKSYGWFVPKETGTYSFGVDGDDGVDIVIDGVVITSFYGPHGYGGYRYGNVNLVAGKSYTFMVRMQNVSGGWGVYAVWKRPSQSSWSVQANEVYSTKPNEPTKKALANFNLNTVLDATKFSINSTALSTAGSVDVTTSLDSNKVNTGYKATTTGGQVEWCVIYDYEAQNGRYRVGIDSRQMTVNASTVNQLKLFDLWDGNITYGSYDANGWSEYYIYTNTQFNFNNSSYASHIRKGNGYYTLTADFSFTPTTAYKTQSISLTTTNNLTTLYNSIVTVSDVYLAFKELANGGIFGNQTGNEFVYGIQYKNADINDDGMFDESDCFALLQHLTGTKALVDTFNLNKTLKIIPQTTYNNIGKSTWNTFTTPLGSNYSFNINTGKPIDTLNLAVTWKGDVNLSHSTTPPSNGITTMGVKSMSITNEVNASIITEVINGKVCATITLDPLQQQVVGTQFQLNYDKSILKFESVEFKTKGTPTNYGFDKGDYINVGSLISDGSTTLDNTTEYKIIFTALLPLDNVLGLMSIGSTDAVNKTGTQLKVKIN